MDVHPAGVPHLVGPEGGSGFSQYDFSAQFRVLPSNISSDITPPNLDFLPTTRSQMQGLHLNASSAPSPRFSSSGQPLRLRDEHSKAASPRSCLSPRYLLLPEPNCFLPSSDFPPPKLLHHSVSLPARSLTEEAGIEDFLPLEGEALVSVE